MSLATLALCATAITYPGYIGQQGVCYEKPENYLLFEVVGCEHRVYYFDKETGAITHRALINICDKEKENATELCSTGGDSGGGDPDGEPPVDDDQDNNDDQDDNGNNGGNPCGGNCGNGQGNGGGNGTGNEGNGKGPNQ